MTEQELKHFLESVDALMSGRDLGFFLFVEKPTGNGHYLSNLETRDVIEILVSCIGDHLMNYPETELPAPEKSAESPQ